MGMCQELVRRIHFQFFNQKKDLYRRGLRAEHLRRLEFGKALSLRTRLTGLLTVESSSSRRTEGARFPVSPPGRSVRRAVKDG
jgi:hypothetical protein